MEMSNSMIEKVKAVIAAPSCCAELRAVAEEWLLAVGTDGEKEASAKLIAELEEDVSTLDDVIPFFESETGAQFFGADVAKAKAEEAKKAKAEGATYCLCPACQAGASILAEKDSLL